MNKNAVNIASDRAIKTNVATGYVIKDVITDLENGESVVYFTGVDDYVWDYASSPEPFKRRGNAQRKIDKEVGDNFWGRFEDKKIIGKNSYIESGRHLHVLTIEEVVIEDR